MLYVHLSAKVVKQPGSNEWDARRSLKVLRKRENASLLLLSFHLPTFFLSNTTSFPSHSMSSKSSKSDNSNFSDLHIHCMKCYRDYKPPGSLQADGITPSPRFFLTSVRSLFFTLQSSFLSNLTQSQDSWTSLLAFQCTHILCELDLHLDKGINGTYVCPFCKFPSTKVVELKPDVRLRSKNDCLFTSLTWSVFYAFTATCPGGGSLSSIA